MDKILSNPLGVAVALVGAGLLLVLAVLLAKTARRAGSARVVQIVALTITMSYSGLTSWQWSTARLHAPVWERGIVFTAFEVVMLAFAVASRENRLKAGRSGWQHTATLFFAGLMSLMALQVAGSPLVAAVRFGGGPLAALLLFHSLLGLELRHQGTARESLLRSALQEVRERIVSRLGIGRRGAGSAQIARSRAADRAVALASRRTLGNRAAARLSKAVDAAQHGLGVEDAAAAEASIVDRVVRRKSIAGLHGIDARHVWRPSHTVPTVIDEGAQEVAEEPVLQALAPVIYPLPQRPAMPSFRAFAPQVIPSQSEEERARALRRRGLSFEQIGARLGRSKSWAHRASHDVPVANGSKP